MKRQAQNAIPTKAAPLLAFVGMAFLLLVVAAVRVPAQTSVGGTGTGGFKMPQFDSQNRLRSLVTGKGFKSGTNFNEVDIEGLRVEAYREDGKIDFVAEAPACRFIINTREASSDGPLRAYSGDGRLEITGRGFAFAQTNMSLAISNEVQTLIRRDTNAPNAPPMKIRSGGFNFQMSSNRVVYTDGVQVEDPQMRLTSQSIIARLVDKSGGLDSIEALGDVVMKGVEEDIEVKAQRAVYRQKTEQVELTGTPKWRQLGRSGSAERILVGRNDKSVESSGNVIIRLPRSDLGQGGLMAGSPDTSGLKLPPVTDTNRLVEIFCDVFTVRSNITKAVGTVRVVDGQDRLLADQLTLQRATKTNPEEIGIAEGNLRIEQGERNIQADRAIYTKSADTIVFTGAPRWALELGNGFAERLIIRPASNVVEASGGVTMNIKRSAGASVIPVFPETVPSAKSGGNDQPVQITSQFFEIRDRVARFTGNVSAHELPKTGAEPRLACPVLEVKFAEKKQQVDRAVARGGVLVEQGIAGQTNGPAAYQRLNAQMIVAQMHADTGQLAALSAEGEVRVVSPTGRAQGDLAVYQVSEDVLRLTGNPSAETEGLIVSEARALIWNRGRNTISAESPYKMRFSSKPNAKANPLKLMP